MKYLCIGNGISIKSVIRILESKKEEYEQLDIGDIKSFDYKYAIKSPSISLNHPSILNLILNNVKIISDFELFCQYYNKDYIGITGTNGKTTTTMLIGKMTDGIECGNIGYPLLDAVLDSEKIPIIESSSFELESTLNFKPKIAVLLPIKPSHIDHHSSFINYFNSKMNLINNLDSNCFLVYPYDDLNIKEYIKKIDTNKISYSISNPLADCYLYNNYIYYKKIKIINIKNMFSYYDCNILDSLAAICTSITYGVNIKKIRNVLKSFKPALYRITKIGKDIYNDSKSTNVYSTIEALKSFNLVNLIVGGYDRGEDFLEILKYKEKINKIYAFGEIKNRIKIELKELNVYIFDSLEEIVKSIDRNNTILFSPMAPSYDIYNNYIERGNHFTNLVNKYLI